MASKAAAAASFDEMLRTSRKERAEKLAQEMLGTDPKKLAQDMLGKQRRIGTPRANGPPTTLASRLGVNKRSNSLPRSNAAPPSHPRMPTRLTRPSGEENYRPQTVAPTLVPDPPSEIRPSKPAEPRMTKPAQELNIRGAASGPYVIRAQNFAPGTTAADIQSVMESVGGQLTYCKLIAANPTVIAEIGFVERSGADNVIQTFNNKRADGRILYVYNHMGNNSANGRTSREAIEVEPEALAPPVIDETMEVDEMSEERVVQDKLREERRGREAREPRKSIPSGPQYDRQGDDYYNRDPRRPQPDAYQDGRYGYGGSDRYGSRGGRFRDEGRMYSDRMRGGGPRGYRP